MKVRNVSLEPISEYEYQAYIENSIKEYAAEKIKSGNWKEGEAIELSRKEFGNLLPNGIKTPGVSIFSIIDNDTKKNVGVLWVEWNRKEYSSTYIWDIVIYKEFRQKGYGHAAMEELEKVAKINGSKSIVLHVFGHNKPAISMYEKLGYYPTNIIMRKEL